MSKFLDNDVFKIELFGWKSFFFAYAKLYIFLTPIYYSVKNADLEHEVQYSTFYETPNPALRITIFKKHIEKLVQEGGGA